MHPRPPVASLQRGGLESAHTRPFYITSVHVIKHWQGLFLDVCERSEYRIRLPNSDEGGPRTDSGRPLQRTFPAAMVGTTYLPTYQLSASECLFQNFPLCYASMPDQETYSSPLIFSSDHRRQPRLPTIEHPGLRPDDDELPQGGALKPHEAVSCLICNMYVWCTNKY